MAISMGDWLLPAKKAFCRTPIFAWLRENYRQASWFLHLKAYFEQNELDIALARLRVVMLQSDFELAQVAQSLQAFSVSQEEQEQLSWFVRASHKQHDLEQALNQEQADIPALLKALVVELGYVANASNLYQKFGLSLLQQKVQQMIEQLTQRLDILIELQKRQQQQQDLRLKLEREQQLLQAQQLEVDKIGFERDKTLEQCRLVELEMERQQTRIRQEEAEMARLKLEMQNRREAQALEQMQQMQQALAAHQALGSLSS